MRPLADDVSISIAIDTDAGINGRRHEEIRVRDPVSGKKLGIQLGTPEPRNSLVDPVEEVEIVAIHWTDALMREFAEIASAAGVFAADHAYQANVA